MLTFHKQKQVSWLDDQPSSPHKHSAPCIIKILNSPYYAPLTSGKENPVSKYTSSDVWKWLSYPYIQHVLKVALWRLYLHSRKKYTLFTINHHSHPPHCHFLLVAGWKLHNFSLEYEYSLSKVTLRTSCIYEKKSSLSMRLTLSLHNFRLP